MPRGSSSVAARRANPCRSGSIEPDVTDKGREAGLSAMTCRELTDFLDDYFAGELRAEVRGRFEAHLVECRECLTYLRDYRTALGLLRETGRDGEAEAPAEVPAPTGPTG